MTHYKEGKGRAGRIDLEALEAMVQAGEIDTVLAVFPDMFGRFMGKRITGRFFLDEIASHGMHACDYLLACDMEMDPVPGYAFTSWKTGYGDFHAVPDLATLRVLPWLEKTALVVCDLANEETGAPVPVAPRQILRRQIERARSLGFLPLGASELEFYLFRETYESAKEKRYHGLATYGWYIEDYHILQGTKEEWLIRAIRNGMDGAGVPVEFSKGEWGPGQHEINLRYCDFLEMADRHALYKHGAKEIAALQGVAVSFMAKWNEKLAGSGCHMHASLWDLEGKRSLFADPKAPGGASEIFRWWLGGLLAHSRELALFFAPYVNSYKRFQIGSFAPTKIVWSRDNRTAGLRIVGHGDGLRTENRMPGADANPYLAYAATLAAGLAGIENRIDPGPAFEGDAYTTPGLPTVPMTLSEAILEFERSELARSAFGEDVVGHYLHAARTEVRKFGEVVTCWELERNFERA
ncbi:MAG: glutamine synthetase [Planctomycetes bacterium]|nr:glutamine synthetase [Planctomycetota bacterium]